MVFTLVLMTSTVFAENNNRITINSKNSNGEFVKGFEYTFESDKLSSPVKLVFGSSGTYVLDDLEDDVYHIKETKTAEGYEKSKDYTVKLPTKDGHTSVIFTPKPVKAQKPAKENQYVKTGTNPLIIIVGLGVLLLTLLVSMFWVYGSRGSWKKLTF